MNFDEELKYKTAEIDKLLLTYLPKEEGFQKTVLEAANYSVLAGGKRLRPLMMKETYVMFGGSGKVIEPFMAAIEMIHTYSLVHDDLPAMDNDEYRRGKKTTHAVYGEAMGILAGDALLNLAYETAASAFDIDPSPHTAKALKILSEKAGIYGMVGGQAVDVESEGKNLSEGQLDFIYRLKTGALLEASMMTGAVLAGASDGDVETIGRTALDVGLAFQIRDDILDVAGTPEVLGKPINSDDKNNKTTYVTLKGLEKAEKDVETISGRALSTLGTLGCRNEFLEELIKKLITRKK